jgi:hypothetical protein
MPFRVVSADLKRVAVRLLRAFPISVVAVLLDISEDTIRRVVSLSESTGDVVPPPASDTDGIVRGRKRLLSEEDLAVWRTYHKIDSY